MFFTTIKKKRESNYLRTLKSHQKHAKHEWFSKRRSNFHKIKFPFVALFFFFLMTLPQSQPPVMLLLGEAAVCAEKRVWRNSKGECCKAYLLILYVNLHMSFLGLTSEIHLCDPKYSRKDFEIWTKIYALPESQTNT